MKTQEHIARELDELIQDHYYREDFELVASVRAYQEGLGPAERETLRAVVLRRLLDEGSMVDIILCAVVEVPSAAPVLALKLDRESVPSQLTRALITALQGYHGEEVFRAVERFVDSDQEGEALAALARIDFVRALPYLARALECDHHLGPILHILHARSRKVGVAALVLELQSGAARLPAGFRAGLRRALAAKQDDYNPFSGQELNRLRQELA